MNWKNLSHSKKGLIVGIAIGLVFALYSNIAQCHPQILGGGVDACKNSAQLIVGIIEFLIYFIFAPIVSFLPFSAEIKFRILLIISPIILFGLIGFLFGFLKDKAKR